MSVKYRLKAIKKMFKPHFSFKDELFLNISAGLRRRQGAGAMALVACILKVTMPICWQTITHNRIDP